MKDDSNMRELRERVWRRELTPQEREQMRAQGDPALKPDLVLEEALTSALHRVPEAAVSSNFTQRILQELEREQAAAIRRAKPAFSLRRWLPRLAAGCAVLAGVFLWQQKLEADRSAEMARSVAILTAPALSPEILQDFDAIQVMSQTPSADEQLLAAMQ